MVTLARRGTQALAYNPLADGGREGEATDTWVCVSDYGAKYHTSPSIAAAGVSLSHGTKVSAVKQGDWLVENGSDLYLPYKDFVTGKRLFKNERALLMEQLANQGGGQARQQMRRQTSSDSIIGGELRRLSSISSLEQSGKGAGKMSRQTSLDSICNGGGKMDLRRRNSLDSVGSTPSSMDLRRRNSLDSVGSTLSSMDLRQRTSVNSVGSTTNSVDLRRANSLNSVGSTRSSMELRRAKSQGSLDAHSSFWICVAREAVPRFAAASREAAVRGSCAVGAKVQAVKEGEWLRLLDAARSVDVAGALLARRSLRLSEKVELRDTGLFVPLVDPVSGARLFKNEKVEIWEQARAKKENQVSESGNQTTCALM